MPGLRVTDERRDESGAGFAPTFKFSNFWRLGSTFVTSQILLLSSPTVSSAQTLTVKSLPAHFRASVISSSLAASLLDAIGPKTLVPSPAQQNRNEWNSVVLEHRRSRDRQINTDCSEREGGRRRRREREREREGKGRMMMSTESRPIWQFV